MKKEYIKKYILGSKWEPKYEYVLVTYSGKEIAIVGEFAAYLQHTENLDTEVIDLRI